MIFFLTINSKYGEIINLEAASRKHYHKMDY